MKVEDIQIGDWVQNPLGAPYQVLAIHFYKINGDGDGYYGIHLKNKGAEARLEIYDLHPVPLTPEILEKNGWEHKWWWVHPSTCICFQEKITGDFRVMPNTECDKRDWFATIKYVHELQHLYKICGIDKEIVL